MGWRPIDFQGIIDLDPRIIEHLEQFLKEKENRLAYKILNLIPSSLTSPSDLSLPVSEAPVKLSEAVEQFSKKVRLFVKSNSKHQSVNIPVRPLIEELNSILWEFTEVLKGCVVELFQQVPQVPIDRWHLSISYVIHSIKDILIHYIEDLMWAIQRLEKPLKEYSQKFDLHHKAHWWDWVIFKKKYLDRNLMRNLYQTEKFLKKQCEIFYRQHHEYMAWSVKIEEDLQKMKTYSVLALLEISDQNLYVDVFRLLKMIELNHRSKKGVAVEIARSLKYLTSIDHILHVLRVYYRELKDAFFNSSLEWKSLNHEGENFQEALKRLQDKVVNYQQELRELMQTMSRYRTFMLKSGSNPYARSRWGFTEWTVGPEPAKAKKVLNMIYSAEELDSYFTHFIKSLTRTPLVQHSLEHEARQNIDRLLHEVGQPLVSYSMMQNRTQHLLEQLEICDEIGSPTMSTVYYVEDILAKVMREDWKYHVLHEFPLFHRIYHLHQGLIEYFEDPSHSFRIERFYLLFDQIKDWIDKGDVYSHVREIELDMNDMKTYLQDFLAAIQRAAKDKSHDPFLDETIYKLRHQLLEYRYIFGEFFSDILSKSPDGRQLRKQFLFIDQYFESMENLLHELKASWEGKV